MKKPNGNKVSSNVEECLEMLGTLRVCETKTYGTKTEEQEQGDQTMQLGRDDVKI